MKTAASLLIGIIILCTSCNTAQTGSDHGSGTGKGLRGSAYDVGNDNDTNADPDGVAGNASTYGTGTGVGGQTPGGTGSGEGNTGRSGVGIKKGVKTK